MLTAWYSEWVNKNIVHAIVDEYKYTNNIDRDFL